MDLHEAIGRLNNGKPKKKKIVESRNRKKAFLHSHNLVSEMVASAYRSLKDYKVKDIDEIPEDVLNRALDNAIMKHLDEPSRVLDLAVELNIIDLNQIVTDKLKKMIVDSEDLRNDILLDTESKLTTPDYTGGYWGF